MKPMKKQDWPLRLYNRSVLKQAKYKQIERLLGPTEGLCCLDIGSDNGVVSYLLRQRGGHWKSADLSAEAVQSITDLVGSDVCRIDGHHTPYEDEEFDRIVIVDFLEHIPDDAGFVAELDRILKPDGVVIINVPHLKPGLLRMLRQAIGQTDSAHGHLRPGYTAEQLRILLDGRMVAETYVTYSKFFSELIDTFITGALALLKKREHKGTAKGVIVTETGLRDHASLFGVYSLLYPVVWLFSRMDRLLFFASGYMLIVRAKKSRGVG